MQSEKENYLSLDDLLSIADNVQCVLPVRTYKGETCILAKATTNTKGCIETYGKIDDRSNDQEQNK